MNIIKYLKQFFKKEHTIQVTPFILEKTVNIMHGFNTPQVFIKRKEEAERVFYTATLLPKMGTDFYQAVQQQALHFTYCIDKASIVYVKNIDIESIIMRKIFEAYLHNAEIIYEKEEK